MQIEAIPVRRIDLYFKHAEWRMTEADGQIGIADLVLSNFLWVQKLSLMFAIELLYMAPRESNVQQNSERLN